MAKKLKEMYETYLEFPEGWRGGGGLTNNPFRGGIVNIFWNYTLLEIEQAENLLNYQTCS